MKKEESANAFWNESIYATDIFKTILQIVQDTKERYSRQFLIDLLTGNERIIRKPEYQKLPGYKSLPMGERKLEGFFRLLLKYNYLIVKDKYFGVLKLTDLGKEFLKNPSEEYVIGRELYFPGLYIYIEALSEVRKEIAQQSNCKPFEVCPEYVIEQLAIAKPSSREGLAEISSIRIDLTLHFWDAFLQRIRELKKTYIEIQRKELNDFDKLPELKELIKTGKSVDEIAYQLEVNNYKVKKLIEQLHYCKEMNLRSWIEKQVALDILQRTASFFKTSGQKSLKIAKDILELDYETLRYGRMYAYLS